MQRQHWAHKTIPDRASAIIPQQTDHAGYYAGTAVSVLILIPSRV